MFKGILAAAILSITTTYVNAFNSPLYDDFNGSSLDKSIWKNSIGTSCVSVAGGVLNISGYWCYPTDGDPGHKRVESLQQFTPSSPGIDATGRIYISGDYEKFGFFTDPAPDIGIYFDTYDKRFGNNINTTSAIVYSYNTRTELFHQMIPASWGSYHDLTINWKLSEIEFMVDGKVSVTFPYPSDHLSLPVGIWNDRTPTMQVDMVSVSAVPEPASIWLMATSLVTLLGVKRTRTHLGDRHYRKLKPNGIRNRIKLLKSNGFILSIIR